MRENKVIYVVCPDRKKPIGGVKQLYRLVDTLNAAGYEAYIVHGSDGFRVDWFEHDTPIRYFPYLSAMLYRERKKKKKLKLPLFIKRMFVSNKLPENDSIMVFPEIYGPNVNDLVPHNEIVIFNQNCYYTFDNYSLLETSKSPYVNPKTLGCLVVSQDSLDYMQFAFPKLPTYRIRLGLSDHFTYCGEKKKQIAFMPRKLAEDFKQVFHLFSNRTGSRDWKFVAIDDLSETEVAEILKESAIFLSFNHQEGFGLPPVEAMACGCYVIGYTGQAGKEYLDPECCTPIATRDVIAFSRALEEVTSAYDIDPAPWLAKGKTASDFVKEWYNRENETADILKAWDQLMRNGNG